MAASASKKGAMLNETGKKPFMIRLDNIIDMETKELIQKEIELFPDQYLEEILDFIQFLKAKALKNKMEAAILSESILEQDWLSPEEDEAWKNL